MARGWESKDVESRQEQHEYQRERAKHALESAEEQKRRQHQHLLLLERTRLQGELQRACNPRFRGQLEAALAYVENELKQLDSGKAPPA